MECKNVNELRVDIHGQLSSSEQVVASPMSQLAMNFEGICTRTPTGPSKGTPRRKLSLCDVENNAATPIILTSISRTLSNESGYCPSPDREGSLDSPSADFISARKRSFSKIIRRPNFLRSISSPLTFKNEDSGKEENYGIAEEFDENNNKENNFEFVKPTMPVHRSAPIPLRPTSCPPELQSPGGSSHRERKDSESMSITFSVDEDDDGFVDYTELEQTEDEIFTMSSTVAGLITAPLTASRMQGDTDICVSDGNTPKYSGETDIQPCNLFHPITCNVSPDVRTRRSKSLSIKRPVPPRDPSPEERKKMRGRCSSAQEASWNSPLLIGMNRVPAKSPLRRSLSVVEPKARPDIDKFLTTGQDNSNLTGDFSKSNILPTIVGQHQDLKTITPEMVTRVLDQEFEEINEFFIVDCRYPYEYEGGHIKTAINLSKKEAVYDFFMKKPKSNPENRIIVIFHCEFSSKRAPSMYRYLRNKDRDSHTECYPKLFYPEMYVIQGGYKAFFESCKEYCEPQSYRLMADENFTQELKRFSKRSKSWTEGQTVRKSFRKGIDFH